MPLTWRWAYSFACILRVLLIYVDEGRPFARAYRQRFPDPVETCGYVPSKYNVCGLKTPFAAAEGEWIKDDQQGKLFEALKLLAKAASFCPAGFHLFD